LIALGLNGRSGGSSAGYGVGKSIAAEDGDESHCGHAEAEKVWSCEGGRGLIERRGLDLAGGFAEAMNDGEEKNGGDEEETAADDVVAHLAVMLQPGDVERNDVVDNEETEADEVEEVSEQDCTGDDDNVGVQAETVDVASDERDKAHGDGAADSVAAGSDEHAEVWREHEAELIVTEGLTEGDGEDARYVGGDALQGEVNVDVEDVGDGVDEPDEDDGEESCAVEAGSAEEQHNAGDVSKRHERMRWEVDGTLRRHDEDEDGLIANMNGGDGDGEDGETPEAALHLPLLRAPDSEYEHSADERNHHADGLKGVHSP
jgi:hypothetical protein